jgi:uncharacterized membrane protein
MDNLILASVLNFLHLFATVAWFGALTTNAFILMPSIRESLEPPTAGKLMGAVMRRFRILVYTSMGVLIVTGIFMTSSMKFMQFTNLWSTISSIKHIFIIIVVVLVIYAFEGLGRKVSRLAQKGPSPELAGLQKKQIIFSKVGLVMAIIILILTGILTAI